MITSHTLSIPYLPAPAEAFSQGSGGMDTLLLESADIHEKTGIQSLAILRSALRLTCLGEEVTVTPLTPFGETVAAGLAERLAEYRVDAFTFRFPRATATDERERLIEPSSIAVIRAALEVSGGPDGASGAAPFPFIGGGFAFDYLATFEDLPPVEPGSDTFPDYYFLLAEVLLTVDHVNQTAALHGFEWATLGEYADALAEVGGDVSRETAGPTGSGLDEVTASLSDDEFRAAVMDLQQHIYNGDIYQVVPSRTFTLPCPDAFAAYRELRELNPSPYMFYLHGTADGEFELFGASPESNLKFDPQNRHIELYPIAGTRPRGETTALDTRNELELRTDAKEIAEHTMLVDLARNDLARVAAPGTRQVDRLMQVDRYSAVMHLVSQVSADLAEGLDGLDAFRACMTMGTLTGAPKLKAAELIRSVEKRRRGSYGGAVGYVTAAGELDTCIVIRSAFAQRGLAHVAAGAGVVRDSDPQAEADETRHKARATLAAIARAAAAQKEVSHV
ncbi:MAG: anthranilate synthase component 1 [Corynebacterium sp.]|nr:anthranilate synthase component 1 [Corynebacterium sp.]